MIVIYDEARSPDIYYRCRWNSECEVLYVEDSDSKTLHVPGFEYVRAKKEVLGGVEVVKLQDIKKTLEELEGDVIVPGRFPAGLLEYFDGWKTEKQVFPERKIKSLNEISAIEEAQKIALEAYKHAERIINKAELADGVLVQDGEPLTSEFLRAMIRSFLMHRGYDCPDVIVSSGGQTSLPHHRGSGPIVEGPVIIDIFPRSDKSRYHGDFTRTIIVGSDPHATKMLDAVRKVFSEIIEKCVPGTKASELGALAEKRLSELGFPTENDAGLVHALGHGVGLSIHEKPTLHSNSEDELEENMVVAIEPGLYYEVGVRYENLIVVREEPVVLSAEKNTR